MKLIPLTQGKFAQVDDEDYEWLMQWKWFYHNKGYAARLGSSHPRRMILMHREIMKTPEGMDTDHINADGEMDGLNNQRYNLRVCTTLQNMQNKNMYSNNKSGYKGVTWHKRDKVWIASIRNNGKSKHLGSFNNPEIAAHVYDEAAIKIFGRFARLNFPDQTEVR